MGTHQNRSGEGVAEFGSRGDMEYALDKLDGAELGGRRIRIFEEGKGGGGGGGGRGRSLKVQVKVEPTASPQVSHSLQVPLKVSRQIEEVCRQGSLQVAIQVWSQEVQEPQPQPLLKMMPSVGLPGYKMLPGGLDSLFLSPTHKIALEPFFFH